MKQEDYVSFEVAQELRKKEYNEACHAFYHNRRDKSFFQAKDSQRFSTCEYPYHNENKYLDSAPTLWNAQKWLREKHNIIVEPAGYKFILGLRSNVILWSIDVWDMNKPVELFRKGGYDTYEQALNAGILKALEYLT